MTSGAKPAGGAPAEPSHRAPLIELGLGAAWLVGLAAMVSIFDQLLGPGSLGAAILGALAIDLFAKRAGVRWDREDPELDAHRNAARRIGVGAACVLVVGGLAIAASGALGGFHAHVAPPSSALAFAAVRAGALAVRDELLFRGVPLAAAARARVPAPLANLFAGLVSGASIALLPGVTPAAVALAVGSGWLFAALWSHGGGAWAAVGGHAAWLLLVGSVIHGGLFDLDWTTGELAASAHASGPPAWLVAAALTAAAFAVPRLPWIGAGRLPLTRRAPGGSR